MASGSSAAKQGKGKRRAWGLHLPILPPPRPCPGPRSLRRWLLGAAGAREAAALGSRTVCSRLARHTQPRPGSLRGTLSVGWAGRPAWPGGSSSNRGEAAPGGGGHPGMRCGRRAGLKVRLSSVPLAPSPLTFVKVQAFSLVVGCQLRCQHRTLLGLCLAPASRPPIMQTLAGSR